MNKKEMEIEIKTLQGMIRLYDQLCDELEAETNQMNHPQREVDNYKACLNLITNTLLNSLEKLEVDYEQYFNECNILGVDRLSMLKRIRNLIQNYQKQLLIEVQEFQESVAKQDKGVENG